MKQIMFLCRRSSLAILCCIVFAVGYAQDYSIEQKGIYKIYTGKYTLCGKSGRAKYQFREDSEDKRIFEGEFKFKSDDDELRVIGSFKDDYQVGEWKWKRNNVVDIINFDDNGNLHGEFRLHSSSIQLYGSIINHKLSGEFEAIYNHARVKGSFRNGKCVGIWHLYFKSIHATMEYDNEGKPENEPSYRFWHILQLDNSTGDNIYKATYPIDHREFDHLPDGYPLEVMNAINWKGVIFRSTKFNGVNGF